MSLCKSWKKERPIFCTTKNIFFLLYNCEYLSTHQTDLDVLLFSYSPQKVILTGVGSLIRKLLLLPNYYWISQKGSNSFGGVAILIHNSLKSKTVHSALNFLLIEIDIVPSPILVGAVYVPPKEQPPFDHFSKCVGKEFYIFGDFNAKHSLLVVRNQQYKWMCSKRLDGNIWLGRYIPKSPYVKKILCYYRFCAHTRSLKMIFRSH